MKNLGLLLASDKDLQPILKGGLPAEATHEARQDATRATSDGPKPTYLLSSDNLSDLPEQRWGVVLPRGKVGEELRKAIEPLIEARAAQQRTKAKDVRIYEVDPGMSFEQATKWMERDLINPEKSDKTRTRYLLFLGDLDKISLETQQAVSVTRYTGRLAFSDIDGKEDPQAYAAYARKVLHWEEPAQAKKIMRTVTFSARGGDEATEGAYDSLMSPARKQTEDYQDDFPVKLEEVRPDSSFRMRTNLLELARDPDQITLLWSMSHGCGVGPDDGDYQAQRERQGAPVLGDKRLTADKVATDPFLPGGFWFLFACFGAGTPGGSAYLQWLQALVESGKYPDYDPSKVLGTLPRGNRSAFIAATPKAALANPKGPLAVLGHIDLAWSYSYDKIDGSGTAKAIERFLQVPQMLARRERRHRAGAAVASFMGDLNQVNRVLTEQYGEEEKARREKRPSTVDPTQRGLLWMLRQDLGAYLLLGDPAVQLPLAPLEKEKPNPATLFGGMGIEVVTPDEASPGDSGESETGKPSVEVMVTAVLDTLGGEKGPKVIAREAGVSSDDVSRWVDAYKKAGEAAMAELRRGRSG